MDDRLRKLQRELIKDNYSDNSIESFIHAVMRTKDEVFILHTIEQWLDYYNEKANHKYILEPQSSQTSDYQAIFKLCNSLRVLNLQRIYRMHVVNTSAPMDFEVQLTGISHFNTEEESRHLLLTQQLSLSQGEVYTWSPPYVSMPDFADHQRLEISMTCGEPVRVTVIGERTI